MIYLVSYQLTTFDNVMNIVNYNMGFSTICKIGREINI